MVAQADKSAQEDDHDSPLYAEKCWPLSEVKDHVHGAPNRAVLTYWAKYGVINRFVGNRVFLETIRFPRGRATSDEAIKRFIRKINSPTIEHSKPDRRSGRPKRKKLVGRRKKST